MSVKIKKYFINYFILFINFLIIPIKNDPTRSENEGYQLNNIITIGDKDYRYVNFATNSNRDMIIEITSYNDCSRRMFYGIKSDGRPFYNTIDTEKETYFYSIESELQHGNRYEAENFILANNMGKEFLINIAKDQSNIELYNFNENTFNQINLLGIQMDSLRGTTLNYILNNKKYIIFCFTKDNSIYLKTLYFSDTGLTKGSISFEKSENCGKSISCFLTDSKYIICIYLCQVHTLYIRYGPYICIIVLDYNLREKNTIYLENNIFNIFEKMLLIIIIIFIN